MSPVQAVCLQAQAVSPAGSMPTLRVPPVPPGPCQRHPHPVGDPAGGRERLGTPAPSWRGVQRCHPGVPGSLAPGRGSPAGVGAGQGRFPPLVTQRCPARPRRSGAWVPQGPPVLFPLSPSSTPRAAPRPVHGSPQPCVPVACVPQRGPPNPSSPPKAVGASPPESGARGGHHHRGWGWQDQRWNQNWDQHKAQDLPIPIPPFPLPPAPPGFGSAAPHRPCKKARGAFKKGLLSASVCLHLPPPTAAPLHSHGAGILPLAPFPLGRGTPGAPPGPSSAARTGSALYNPTGPGAAPPPAGPPPRGDSFRTVPQPRRRGKRARCPRRGPEGRRARAAPRTATPPPRGTARSRPRPLAIGGTAQD